MNEMQYFVGRRLDRLQRAVNVLSEEVGPRHPAINAAHEEIRAIHELLGTIPNPRNSEGPGDQPGPF